jgi:predicted dehydrogenase
MTNKIKYGVIGTGVMGREHIENINIIESAEVVAICDTNENSRNQTKSLVKTLQNFIMI